MSIDLTPITNLIASLTAQSGVPPMLYYAVAGVMTLVALHKLWGYIMGAIIFYWVLLHPAVLNAAINEVAKFVTQLLNLH